MYILENEFLRVTMNEKGAELSGIFHKKNNLEYLWNGNPQFWAKTSPVLFPIVGGLKENKYFFENQVYSLPRHGFARDQIFEVEDHWDDGIIFLLTSDEQSKKVFPFDFELRLTYELFANVLSVSYHVINTGDKEMFFSIGGHPAFAVPLDNSLQYEDYYLEFEEEEVLKRYPLSSEGLVLTEPIPMYEQKWDEDDESFMEQESKVLGLKKELFYEDALVFKNLKSTVVTLKSDKSPFQLKFDYAGFPFLGIWASKDADFVCIEPWCGIADSVNSNQKLEEKEGIQGLLPDDSFERAWAVKLI